MIFSHKTMTITTKKALLVELRNILEKALQLLDTIIDEELGNSKEIDILSNDKYSINENELIEMCVVETLKELGIPNKCIGYSYIKSALIISVEKRGVKKGDFQYICSKISSQYNTTITKIERNMRWVIEKLFIDGDLETINKIFGNSVSPLKGKATNLEFISMTTDYILSKLKKYHFPIK